MAVLAAELNRVQGPAYKIQDTSVIVSGPTLVSFRSISHQAISYLSLSGHATPGGPGRFLVIGRPAPTCVMGDECCRSICRRIRPKGANERVRCEVAGDWRRSAMKR